jgi:adenosylcobinamide kinase/adenosylcobinamide-phosphate guanylyltransferase
MSARTLLVGGGVRCGKSAFALRLAQDLGARRVFVATAQAFDSEMAERIAAHRSERAELFRTVEEPLALPETLRAEAARADVIVIDCLTLWLSNLILQAADSDAVAQRVEDLAGALAERRCHVIMVTNEVGMGLVPETPLGRLFRDCAGRTHQRLVRECDEVYAGILGGILRLRPAPVELIP